MQDAGNASVVSSRGIRQNPAGPWGGRRGGLDLFNHEGRPERDGWSESVASCDFHLNTSFGLFCRECHSVKSVPLRGVAFLVKE